MKKQLLHSFVLMAMVCMGLIACKNKNAAHFITDQKYRQQVMEDWNARKGLMGEKFMSHFQADSASMPLKDYEALVFLYTYMNTSDVADYPTSFYAQNIAYAFKAQEEMPWGKSVPEQIFRHFVLPVRVNNENLDSCRWVFYHELKDRIKDMNMKEAALEVNHWCHEKATYAPSDERTRSPLSTVLNALGRCGEESTFTVAALRAVGIPARQVYTPRWAHTDDNHAWVEVWVDGKWHFMGACEPAADLDDAWFNSSVVRAMLIHTKVFGRYDGPEEILYTTKNYTEINVIDNYTQTDMVEVKVVDEEGKPAEGANVRYCIYNYAEFYPVVTKIADQKGASSLGVGKGDMLVWASKNGRYGYAISHANKREPITITLGDFDKLPANDTFKLTPPPADALPTTATAEQVAANNIRLEKEDSIRHAYEATFASKAMAEGLAKTLQLPADKVVDYLQTARGNHKTIADFLQNSDKPQKAMDMLSLLSQKDLTDTPSEVLAGLLATMPETANDFELRYIAGPRIGSELLTTYRNKLQQAFTPQEVNSIRQNPTLLAKWIDEHIQTDTIYNSQRLICSPVGMLEIGWADAKGKDYFFVAAARSLGIASRIDPVTGKVQYANADSTNWVDINLSHQTATETPQGELTLAYTPTTESPDPQYYSRFTLGQIRTDGMVRTLEYDWDAPLEWSKLFKQAKKVDEGDYLLIAGTRMASGSVLCNISKIRINNGEKLTAPLNLPQDATDIQVIGSINAEQKFYDINKKAEETILNTTGRGYFVLAVLAAGQEPTNHALKDIALLASEFEKWDRKMILLFADESNYNRFKPQDFANLPKTVVWGWDLDGTNAKMIAEATHLRNSSEMPIFVIADTFGRVVFVRQGYTIGLGEQMMNVIRRL